MKKEMLINVLQPEECRIAIVEDGILEELYVERNSHESYTGNIYLGKIVNIESAIQAAFVDFSVGRNGFLHLSDVEPQYYRSTTDADTEEPVARDREPRRDRDKERGRARERDEPRPSPFSKHEEPHPDRFGPSSEAEDRPASPRGPETGRGHNWDFDWDQDFDRPDRSEKPRRDRSTRRFGEGLTDDLDSPQPAPIREASHEATPRDDRDRDRGREEVAPGWYDSTSDIPASHARRDEPARPAERSRIEPEPRGRSAGGGFDPEDFLPPSRTQRSRRPIEPEDAGPARSRIEPEPDHEAGPEPAGEFEKDRERGRGRGRGRSRTTRKAQDLESETLATSRIPVEPAPEPETDFGEPPTEPESPRRRGRDAIRARGGDRPGPRPRELEPIVEPDFEDDHSEPSRERDRSTPRTQERPIESEPSRERDRGRTPPHDRAGEPGYIPRRERSRVNEPSVNPPAEDWTRERPPSRPRPESFASGLHETTDRIGEVEAPEPLEGETKTGRRRRRRPRRRRETEETPSEEISNDETSRRFEGVSDLETEEVESRESRPRHPARRRRRPDDFEDRDESEESVSELDEEHDEVLLDTAHARTIADEEVEPELEEEIRREIEEIHALEREMGLRGTTEARPRRGDDREASSRSRGRGLSKPPIQEIFHRGDQVLVQVIKESIGTKGPTLSTYISIPGRYLVLMPGLNRVGVSRKIADESQRRRLREIMLALNPPKGLGFIVRTAGLDRTKRELAKDLAYLLRLWKVILRRIKKAKAPAPIYQESDMIIRTIRDILNPEIDTIWIDEPHAFERAQEFLKVVMPRDVHKLKFYDERVPLFHKYGLEDEITRIQHRRVDLQGGGSIVIDPTEALVAIDVNSGNFRVEDDAERTAYEMNLRAAREIARQLRLRDLGGVIVNDFIDMRDERHRRGVERALRDAVKRDRARTKILRMSQFGIVQMTRQRIRPSLKRSTYEDCPHCKGAGVHKSAESMAIDVMRMLALAAHRNDIRRVNVSVSSPVATYLNNRKRHEIARIEDEAGLVIHVRHEHDVPAEHLHIDCFDAANNEVRLLPAPPPPSARRGR